jgi:hypothetical protein
MRGRRDPFSGQLAFCFLSKSACFACHGRAGNDTVVSGMKVAVVELDGVKKKWKGKAGSLLQLTVSLQEKFSLSQGYIINYWDEEVDDFVELDEEMWDEFVSIDKPKLKIQYQHVQGAAELSASATATLEKNAVGQASSKKDAFNMIKILGKGAFGTTILVSEKETGK